MNQVNERQWVVVEYPWVTHWDKTSLIPISKYLNCFVKQNGRLIEKMKKVLTFIQSENKVNESDFLGKKKKRKQFNNEEAKMK